MKFTTAFDILNESSNTKIARKGWNGKGMYVEKRSIDVVNNPLLLLKTPTGCFNTWIPSITDLFADDWEIVA